MQWFYSKGHPIRSLKELQTVYHHSVGRNGNLLLDMAPTPDGVIDDAAFARYKAFGDWIRACYGTPINNTRSTLSGSKVSTAPAICYQPLLLSFSPDCTRCACQLIPRLLDPPLIHITNTPHCYHDFSSVGPVDHQTG
jgi:hypothetical protein